MPTLYVVATPIGNLEDITARALRILREVGTIAAEDTRHTGKLLAHFDIHTPQISYHEHNKLARLDAVLAALSRHDVALVSDAGMPGINDPGYELVCAVLEAGYPVVPVPGPSAPIAALAVSGLPTDAFLYLGYLPRKTAARRALLAEVEPLPYTLLFLETPHRLLAALEDLQTTLGDRPIAVARELTKLYEEIFRGPLHAARAYFTTHEPRGEFTLVVGGKPAAEGPAWEAAHLRAEVQTRLRAGQPASQIARELAKLSGWERRAVYRLAAGQTET